MTTPSAPGGANDAPEAQPAPQAHPREGGREIGRENGAEHISALEWLVAGLGLLLVVAAVAFMVVDATRGGGTPPLVRVRADSVVVVEGGGYLVQFTAENRGRETAADVAVVGQLRDGAGEETSRARLDYLPGQSERRGGLFFRRNPRGGVVQLWAEGYQEP